MRLDLSRKDFDCLVVYRTENSIAFLPDEFLSLRGSELMMELLRHRFKYWSNLEILELWNLLQNDNQRKP